MGFRIHRGIFQKLNAERTAYENTFKIGDDGRIKEVDSDGNVTAGYLKVGEQASDADTVDGLHSGSFLRSDANDTATGKITFTNDLKVDNARILITNSSATGGGNFDPTVLAYTAREQGYGRAQLLLASGYSDITIGSSQSNNNHGSTLTFATVNPSNGADYKKFVIGQGNWGSRAGFLDFGYDSGNESKNPHSYINSTDVVFTIDADNNRVGVNNMNPGRTLDVSGDIYASSWVRVGGSQGLYFQTYGGGWHMTDTTWIRAYNDKSVYTGGSIQAGGYIRANGDGYKVDNTIVINSAGKFVGNIDNSETRSDYFIQEAHGNPRNNLGSPTVTEMALFDSQFRCMTDLSNNYTNLDRLTFWVQQDEGGPWEEITTYSDTNKKKFLRTNNSGVVIPNRAYKFRVEFKAPGYVYANALYFYWSSNSHSTKVHVYKYNASQDTWHAHATSNTNVSSWPGHLYLPFSTIPWHETHTTSTGHHRYIRVEFIPNWSTGSYADRDINLYGGQIWGGYPSGRRTVHSINENGSYYFPANLYAEGGSGDGSRLATRDWVGSNTLNQTEGDARYLGISAKAADANLLDGINSTSFLRSDANDTFTGTITMGKQHALVANNYGRGVYGTYDSRRYQHVWSMGTAYNLADDGTTAGNLYGIAWTHQNIGGESISGLGHQMLIMTNGDTRTAIGDGIWSKYDIKTSAHFHTTTKTGTWIKSNVMSDAIGWNTSYGVYIGSNIGGTHYLRGNGTFTTGGSTYNLWHEGNDGSGSGLDADTVDGYHASRLFRIDSATQRGPDFNALIPSANETFLKELHAINEGSNAPSAYTYGVLQSTKMGSMKFQWYVPHTASRGDNNTQDTIWFRTGWGGDQIYGWKYLIHSGNIAGQSVNYATTAGTANAVTWANVSGKPSTFTPSSHNHSKITENSTISFGQGSLQWTDLSGNGGDGLNGNTPGNPFNDWHHHIIMNHSNSNGYYVDVAYSFHHDRVHFRRKAGSDPQSWREFWHTGNLSTTKVSNWDTAYGWGNHATQGYLDTVPEEYKTQTQNDARYAAIAHNHSGVYDPAGTAQSVSDDLEPRIAAVETLASRNETGLQGKANTNGSYGQNFNANNVYSDQWFRNTVSGKGLYNEATTQHWYSDGDDYWNIAGGGSFNAIRFRDEHNGTQRGLVGADNSNRIGFLDAGGHWAVRHNNDNGTYFYTDNETLEFRVGRDAVTGNYGTVQTETTRSSWGGYSIDGRVVFMHDHGNWWGIYNDVNNEWMIRGELNGRVELRHNSATKLETTSSGVTVTGTVTATAFAGDGSALTGISAGAPPINATIEGGEASTLVSIHFSPGEGAATFTLADGQTFRLAFAR